MNTRALELASRMPARQVHLVLAGGLFILLALSWVLLLRVPMAEARQLRTEAAGLRAQVADSEGAAKAAAPLRAEVERLAQRLGGADAKRSPDQMLVFLVGELARIGRAQRIDLAAVTPLPPRVVMGFDELPFDVEVTGRYEGLIGWLRGIETDLPGLSIGAFEMRPATTDGLLGMRVRIATTRPAEAGK